LDGDDTATLTVLFFRISGFTLSKFKGLGTPAAFSILSIGYNSTQQYLQGIWYSNTWQLDRTSEIPEVVITFRRRRFSTLASWLLFQEQII
jgi:hypothetical protein